MLQLQEMVNDHQAGFVQFYFFPNKEKMRFGVRAFGDWGDKFKACPAMKLAIKEFKLNGKNLQSKTQ